MQIGAAQFHVKRVLDVFGMAFLNHQHGTLAGAERSKLLRHQRIDHVEHQHRHPGGAEDIGETQPLERAQHGVAEPAHDHNADIVEIAGNKFVQLALADERLRGRHAVFDLEAFVDERHRRMGQAGIVEARRAG